MEKDQLTRLVTGAQNGDPEAIDTLFTQFYNDVYYFALKTVQDADLACDITQETFLEIIRTIGDLKEPAAFVTWMKQITYHQCTRYFRKKKEVLVEEDEDGNTVFDTLADESEGSIPSEVYEKQEFRNTILGIINELTEQQRSAIMMYYFDELTVAQIAQIQGVSEGTVKSRLNYARKAIKNSVEEYEKKHDIRLHSVGLLPLLLLFFGKELMPAEKAAEVGTTVSQSASAMSAGTAVASVGSGVAAAGTVAAATGVAALPVGVKLLALVLAIALAIAAGVGLAHQPKDQETLPATPPVTTAPTTDPLPSDPDDPQGVCLHQFPEGSCICLLCEEQIHTEGAVHPFCGNCSQRLPIADTDGDGACDTCGEFRCGGSHHGASHADEDSDNKCDICQKYMCGLVWGIPHTVNYDDGIYDGKCDLCGQNAGGGMGWGDDDRPHADENGDSICDCCNNHLCGIYGMPEFGGVDHDGDEKCDICQLFMCDGHDGFVYHYDFDHDGKCDRCDHYICIHGYLPHTDEDEDGKCDDCYSPI